MSADPGRLLARAMAMDDATWQRHANPWSVWTRVPMLPVLLAVLWSHVWIGWWGMVALLVPVVVWIWLNPRVFPPPRRTDGWASKATFGERVWLARDRVPIPAHHATAARVLAVVSGAGALAGIVAALAGDALGTIAGGLLGTLGKLWFCDRMVWLYEDMKDTEPSYRAWLR